MAQRFKSPESCRTVPRHAPRIVACRASPLPGAAVVSFHGRPISSPSNTRVILASVALTPMSGAAFGVGGRVCCVMFCEGRHGRHGHSAGEVQRLTAWFLRNCSRDRPHPTVQAEVGVATHVRWDQGLREDGDWRYLSESREMRDELPLNFAARVVPRLSGIALHGRCDTDAVGGPGACANAVKALPCDGRRRS